MPCGSRRLRKVVWRRAILLPDPVQLASTLPIGGHHAVEYDHHMDTKQASQGSRPSFASAASCIIQKSVLCVGVVEAQVLLIKNGANTNCANKNYGFHSEN